MADDLVVYEVPELDADVEVDFIDSDDLEKIEDGIRSVGEVSDFLALVQGIAIVRIEREGLWRQAGFESLHEYRISQNERLGLPRQTISVRRKMGEGYIDNRKLLSRVKLKGNLTKLALLSDALRAHEDPREVLAHFKADTFRDFRDWVYPQLPPPELPEVEFRIRGDSVFLDGVEALTFGEELPADRRSLIADQLRAAARAWAGSCLAHVVPCYDEGEARAVDNFLKKHRAGK